MMRILKTDSGFQFSQNSYPYPKSFFQWSISSMFPQRVVSTIVRYFFTLISSFHCWTPPTHQFSTCNPLQFCYNHSKNKNPVFCFLKHRLTIAGLCFLSLLRISCRIIPASTSSAFSLLSSNLTEFIRTKVVVQSRVLFVAFSPHFNTKEAQRFATNLFSVL
jgi:hypothetical protein